MKRNLFFLLFILFSGCVFALPVSKGNFYSFTPDKKVPPSLLEKYSSTQNKNHPECGTLPFNAPCTDCIELLDKRKADSREFIRDDEKGKIIYTQKSLGDINYTDANGFLRTVDSRLRKDVQHPKIYSALLQPSPVIINMEENISSIINGRKAFLFNKNLELVHVAQNGIETSLGMPDYSHLTAGDNGVLVFDFYPGIDLEIIVYQGRVKTNFILNHPLALADGWLVLRQKTELPAGLNFNLSRTTAMTATQKLGTILVNDNQDATFFYIDKSYAYDADREKNNYVEMPFTLGGNVLSYFVPVNWLAASSTKYPVVIDPFVSSSNNIPRSSIQGSGYTATCGVGGCPYNVSVTPPNNCQIDSVKTSFDYEARNPCVKADGGIKISYLACSTSPLNNLPNCNTAVQGTCFQDDVDLNPDFAACFPARACAYAPMNFSMNFWRCNQLNQGGCDSSCILAISPWVMTVIGRTVEIVSITPSDTICAGANAGLAANANFGVNPFSYSWNPGGAGQVISVTPATTTTYTVTVTDACGVQSTATSTVFVMLNTNPGFNITPNDTVCAGSQITFTGNGVGPASSYDWTINCSGSSNLLNTQSINYTTPATPGSCTVTLNYQVTLGVNTCTFNSSKSFWVTAGTPPAVSITAIPNGTLCSGQSVTFTATPVNGGTTPAYQWYLNGAPTGTNSSTLTLSAPASNFSVSVLLTSNSPCAIPDTVSALINVTVQNNITPLVNITATTVNVCAGQPITFTANPTSAGSSQTYQWQLNGANIGGATGLTYTTSTLNLGDYIGVVMTAAGSCLASTNATDTIHVNITAVVVPSVTISSNVGTTICSGQNIVLTANTVNGGVPTYQWQLNGANIGGATSSTYSTGTAVNGNIYGVIITSTAACANPVNANDTIKIFVQASVTPSVAVNAFPSGTVCSGTAMTFVASPTGGGTIPSYQWYLNGVPTGTNNDSLVMTAPATSFSIKVLLTSNSTCANPDTASTVINITVANTIIPQVNITANNPNICAGQSVTFTANPTTAGTSQTYQWQLNGVNIGGATALTYTTTTLTAGDIIGVLMTATGPCLASNNANDTITINVVSNISPSVNVISNVGNSICSGQSITLTANAVNGGTPTYQWQLNGSNIGGATSQTYTPAVVANGNIYGVIITSSLACAVPNNANDTILIHVTPSVIPGVAISSNENDTICVGTPVTFTAAPTNGGATPVYQWTVNGTPVGTNSAAYSSSTLTNGANVSVTLTSSATCAVPPTASATYLITVLNSVAPTVSITPTSVTVCAGSVVHFDAASTNGGTAPSYQWTVNGNPAGTNSSGFTSSTLTNGASVAVTLTSNSSCASPATATSNTVVVNINPIVTPSVSITSSVAGNLCTGATATFTALPVNGGGAPVIHWYVNGVQQPDTGITFVTSSLTQGATVKAVLVSSLTCVSQSSATSNVIAISLGPPLVVDAIGAATICPYEAVTLTSHAGGGNGGPYHYLWTHGAGDDSVVVVDPAVTTWYAVTATDDCGSAPVKDSVKVTVYPSPDAHFHFSPDEPSSLNPEVDFSDLSNHATSWYWTFGDGDSDTLKNPEHSYSQPGSYSVTLFVMNANGCKDSVTYTLIVKEDISVFVPNAFTPNGDGRNDFFTPIGVSLTNFEFDIYNRWGGIIFHGSAGHPWLGFVGETKTKAPIGVYEYIIDLKDARFEKTILEGRVSLVR